MKKTKDKSFFLGVDLGGTKLGLSIISGEGEFIASNTVALDGRGGGQVGELVVTEIERLIQAWPVSGIGISVPGICTSGKVWAPNIPQWESYPLLEEVSRAVAGIPVVMDSDRSCYILGEVWQGSAKGCSNAIYLGVGTGIGAGIWVNGQLLRGHSGSAGAAGWMAVSLPHHVLYKHYGCLEFHASGDGIARTARRFLEAEKGYAGSLQRANKDSLTAHEVFAAWADGDGLALAVLQECVTYWGMAVANLVSLFDPEKVILGGGVFGPAVGLIPQIKQEAERWAQPISMGRCTLHTSALSNRAGMYGAAYLAVKELGFGTERRSST